MKPYIPDSLPPKNLDYQSLLGAVGSANASLVRFDGLLQGIINPQIMLSPLTNQEAVLSSKIEGTQATVNEVLEFEAGMVKKGEETKDIKEIINYRRALSCGKDALTERPITLSLIYQLHQILLDSVRGIDKNPGKIRKDQNWIGTAGCSIEQASFVPPNPLQLPDYLEQWVEYLRVDADDFLVQSAVVHAQFELLHPFKDGNGRIGRILIPLFLYQKKVLSQPMFYLSEYLETNQEEYYSRLNAISKDNDWNGWILFFLKAIQQQAITNNNRVKRIMSLYEKVKEEIPKITQSQYGIRALDTIFKNPIFSTTQFIEKSEIRKQTTMRILKKLKEHDVLRVRREKRGSRATVYCFTELDELINMAEGKEIV